MVFLFGMELDIGLEEGGTGEGGAKKCPGDAFLARGRVLVSADAALCGRGRGCNTKVALQYAKENHTEGCGFSF